MAARRVYIIGGSGSGKTSLAAQVGQRAGLPVHHLDEVARVGSGNGPLRPAAERDAMVKQIAGAGLWVVEGIHVGWTDDLLEAADVIIWLDHVNWPRAGGRLVRRFVGQAISEGRRQRGWRRFLRLRDYGRHLRELAAALPEARGYHRSDAEAAGRAGGGESAVSRAATAELLARYGDKVIHCRAAADVDAALRRVGRTG